MTVIGGLWADTAVVPTGPGGWAAEVSDRWSIGANPNGGYLMALAVRAMLAESGRADPLSITAHYLSPPVPGLAQVETVTDKSGRSFATLDATLSQGGKPRVRVLGTLGDLAAQSGPTHVGATRPDLKPPEECELLDRTKAQDPSSLFERIELRVNPERSRPRPVAGDGPLEFQAWVRFADGAPPDAFSLLLFTDAFPPAVFGAIRTNWVPTLSLTVDVRARPAPGWLLGVFRTRFLVDGMFEEDGELWDETGRLVSLSRQMGLVLQPRPAP